MATLTAPHLCRTSCGHQSWHVTSASFPSDGTHASLCAWSCCSAWTNAPELLLLLSPRPRPKTSSSPKPPSSECVVRYYIHRFGPHPATCIKPQQIFCLTYVISLKYLFDMLIELSLTPLSIVCVKTVSVWGLSFGEFIIDCSFAMKWHKFKAIIRHWEGELLLWRLYPLVWGNLLSFSDIFYGKQGICSSAPVSQSCIP